MTLAKAIEILELNILVAGPKMPPDTLHALRLSTEAVEFRLRWEQQEGENKFTLLPGQTIE